MYHQSFTIYKRPNNISNKTKKLAESSASTNNAFATDVSYLNENDNMFKELYTKLETIRDCQKEEEEEEEDSEEEQVEETIILFQNRKFKYNFPIIFSEQYFVTINENRDVVKYVLNKEGLFVYNRNFDRYCYYPIYISPDNQLEIENISVSFLPDENTIARFMICIFSVQISTNKITQHLKGIVSCKLGEIYGETFSNVRNRILNNGENRFFIGIMSKNKIDGFLSVTITNNIQKIKTTNLTRKHIGKLF